VNLLITGTSSGLGKYLHRTLAGTAWHRGEPLPARAEVIIHCAWPARVGPEYERDTLELTRRLAGIPHARFVFISTVDVYPADGRVYREDSPTVPIGQYGQTKLAAEHIVGTHSLILRCSAMLGVDARPNSLMRLLRGEPVTLTADSRFNYVLHSDVGAFIRFALAQGLTGIYNVASAEPVTLGEIGITQFGEHRYVTANVNQEKIAGVFPAFRKTSRQVIEEFQKQL
jgi:dTDP-4-dehydrorhamnose reductase